MSTVGFFYPDASLPLCDVCREVETEAPSVTICRDCYFEHYYREAIEALESAIRSLKSHFDHEREKDLCCAESSTRVALVCISKIEGVGRDA